MPSSSCACGRPAGASSRSLRLSGSSRSPGRKRAAVSDVHAGQAWRRGRGPAPRHRPDQRRYGRNARVPGVATAIFVVAAPRRRRAEGEAARSVCSAPGAGDRAARAQPMQTVVDGDDAVGALLSPSCGTRRGTAVPRSAGSRWGSALCDVRGRCRIPCRARAATASPGGVALAVPAGDVQVWRPTQRLRSATIAQQRVIARPSRQRRTRDVRRRSPSRRSGPSSIIVGARFRLGTPGSPSRPASPSGRTTIISSVSGRDAWQHRAAFTRAALGAWRCRSVSPSAMPSFARGLRR